MIIYLRDEFPQSQRLMFSTVRSGSAIQETNGQRTHNFVHALKFEDKCLAGKIQLHKVYFSAISEVVLSDIPKSF